MNKLVIKRIPISSSGDQSIDLDLDKMKSEVQQEMKDYVLEHVTFSLNADHIAILFVLKQYTSKGIGFRTGG
jgi:hypothetical protein